jgi:hypothetical protein
MLIYIQLDIVVVLGIKLLKGSFFLKKKKKEKKRGGFY